MSFAACSHSLRRRLASPRADHVCLAGAVTARERLLAAVSAADALPRGTTFQKVKGARDRLRAELSSVQRTDGDELVKSATACVHRINQRLSRMRKLGVDAPADAPEPAPADLHVEDLRVIRRELWKFRKFMESHYKQFFGPCRLRVSVSTGIFCLTNLFAEVQARMYASLARGRKRKADEL